MRLDCASNSILDELINAKYVVSREMFGCLVFLYVHVLKVRANVYERCIQVAIEEDFRDRSCKMLF